MTDLLLGLDVGTTATKAIIFDVHGNIVASAEHGYPLLTPQPGWVEQDAEELWRVVVATIRSVVSQMNPRDRIVALCQSSQAGTTIPVDAEGQPTYNAISWMDQRAVEQAEAVKAKFGAEFIHATTGWRLHSGLPLQHIAWLKQNRPECFAATRRLFFVNDFIGWRLTGNCGTNPSDAGITQLLNIATGDWDDRLLECAGVKREQLSPVLPSGCIVGHVTMAVSQATGLPENLPVINGAHDQYCAAVGAGVTLPGQVLLSCGTAWVLLCVPPSSKVGLRSGMAVSRHAVPGRWGAIRSLGGVGRSLEWLLDNVWGGRAAGEKRALLYDTISEAARQSSAGANGLLFSPPAGGHAAKSVSGAFVGLTLSHSRDDLARAVMEGIAFELRWAIEEIRAAGVQVSELNMVGGAAKSAMWTRIVADVTGVPVILPAIKQAASLGAAILAGVGIGVFANAESGFAAMRGAPTLLTPAVETRQRYDQVFASYRHFCELLSR
jgi:xylulokinase